MLTRLQRSVARQLALDRAASNCIMLQCTKIVRNLQCFLSQ